MIAWWIYPLVCTLLSILFVTWIAKSDSLVPFAELIAIVTGVVVGVINILNWAFAWFVSVAMR